MIIPGAVENDIKQELGRHNDDVEIKNFRAASGGCINNGGTLSTSTGNFFIKWNDAGRYPGMFEAEEKGLSLLRSAEAIKIPEPIATGESGGYQWILMENIQAAPKNSQYWSNLGKGLAALHKNYADQYGLDHDNYIGSLNQANDRLDNWIEFLIVNRYKPMIKLAIDNSKMDQQVAADFEKLFPKLNSLLVHESPGLIHGDLWGGNLMTDENGDPALIDPAVYHANREIELAFTTLFGGFDQEFYEVYNEEMPLEGGYEDRFSIYNLYPLMVHVNLFGGGYLSQVKQVLSKFV